jgi:hypothetical protein
VVAPASADAEVQRIFDVHDAASFQAALELVRAGDTIRLADGEYAPLTVEQLHFSPSVTIVGGRGAHLEEIIFSEAAGFVLDGVTVTPPGAAQALVHIRKDSFDITIQNVLVDGRVESAGATINTEASTSRVTIRDSELTNCGRAHKCINPNAADLEILDNNFHDCFSCSFVQGFTGGVTITGNTFDRAVPGECRSRSCPHNDLIAIFGGGPWKIVGNRLGTIGLAAAQIYVQPIFGGTVRDVRIASNLFAGQAGVAVRVGIGDRSRLGPPRDVEIVNNTVLSGLNNTAVWLNEPWRKIAPNKRPLIANNVFMLQRGAHCPRGRFVSNLAAAGAACQGIEIGPPNLDPDGLPTDRSTLVIDRAEPRYAPPTDFFGRGRFGPPDRGAFEYRPG